MGQDVKVLVSQVKSLITEPGLDQPDAVKMRGTSP